MYIVEDPIAAMFMTVDRDKAGNVLLAIWQKDDGDSRWSGKIVASMIVDSSDIDSLKRML